MALFLSLISAVRCQRGLQCLDKQRHPLRQKTHARQHRPDRQRLRSGILQRHFLQQACGDLLRDIPARQLRYAQTLHA